MDDFPANISRHIWESKYRLKDSGRRREVSIADTWRRIARTLAAIEPDDAAAWNSASSAFYKISNFTAQTAVSTHHAISEAHLPRYLAEWDFKFNTRHVTDGERAAKPSRVRSSSASRTGSLVKPRTLKQTARKILRLRRSKP